jgi:chemotaxis signal transduction protein
VPNALLFQVESELYALPLPLVAELAPAVEVKPLPSAEEPLLGYIAYRGRPVATFDSRALLAYPKKPIALVDHLVVLRLREDMFALRVDRIQDVVRLPASSLPVPGTDEPVHAVTFRDARLIYLTDIERLLTPSHREAVRRLIADLILDAPATNGCGEQTG